MDAGQHPMSFVDLLRSSRTFQFDFSFVRLRLIDAVIAFDLQPKNCLGRTMEHANFWMDKNDGFCGVPGWYIAIDGTGTDVHVKVIQQHEQHLVLSGVTVETRDLNLPSLASLRFSESSAAIDALRVVDRWLVVMRSIASCANDILIQFRAAAENTELEVPLTLPPDTVII